MHLSAVSNNKALRFKEIQQAVKLPTIHVTKSNTWVGIRPDLGYKPKKPTLSISHKSTTGSIEICGKAQTCIDLLIRAAVRVYLNVLHKRRPNLSMSSLCDRNNTSIVSLL